MATNIGGAANLGPTGGAVATGAISSSVYNSNDTNTSSETTTTSADSAIQSNYGENVNLNGSTGNSITVTDQGAIAGAFGVANTALQSGLQGLGMLSSLTGQALLENSKGVSNQSQPLSVTIAKFTAGVIVVGLIIWGLITAFGRKKS